MGNLSAINAYLALAEALFESSVVQAIVHAFTKSGKLTDEQVASLEANHADYLARIAVREAEANAEGKGEQ